METGVCKLCGTHGDLRRSHIIPEWLFKSIYEPDEHRFFRYSGDADSRPIKRRKGMNEPLLSPACEDLTQVYDDYACRIWDGTGRGVQYLNNNENLVVTGVDYVKMKLFFMITLYRASVSGMSDFSNIHLGQHHEENLRKMILNRSPGKQHEYPILLLAARRDPQVRKILTSALSILPSCKVEGHKAYRFIIGGSLWYLFVSSHLKGTSIDLLCSVKEKGEVWIYERDEHVERVLMDAAMSVHLP